MDLLYHQVFSVTLTLFICSVMCSGVSGLLIWLNNEIHFDNDAVSCQNGDGIVITDISVLLKKNCSNRKTKLEHRIKTAVRRDCSGKLKCGTRNVSNYLKKYKCDDGSNSVTRISLLHECKPFDLKTKPNVVLDMCIPFEKTFSNNINTSLVLKSNTTAFQRCYLKAHEANTQITLTTLQVDFGRQCDKMDDCSGSMNIYIGTALKAELKNLVGNTVRHSGRELELNIHLPKGLLWLEVHVNSWDTINCTQNTTSCSVGDSDDDDDDDNEADNEINENAENDDDTSNKIIVIVTSLAAVIATIVVICLCAVFLCRVKRKRLENLQQNEVQYKPEEAYDYVTLDKDAKVSAEKRTTPENGIYDSAKQFPSEEANYLIAGDRNVGDTYAQVNKAHNSIAASPVCPMTSSGSASLTVTPAIVSEVDEYSHLGNFKDATWNTENVYDG